MMRRKIHLSNAALEDIRNALEWSASNFGPVQRDRYEALIRRSLKELRAGSADHRIRPRADLEPTVQVCTLASTGRRARHFFLLRLLPDGDIEILRLLHESMDMPRHVQDDVQD